MSKCKCSNELCGHEHSNQCDACHCAGNDRTKQALFGTVYNGHVCIKLKTKLIAKREKPYRDIVEGCRAVIGSNVDYTKYDCPVYDVSSMSVSDILRHQPAGYSPDGIGIPVDQLEKFYARRGGIKLQ